MISTVFICLVVTIADIRADALDNEPPQARVDNAKDKDNREQLVSIVDYLNTNNQKHEQKDVNALKNEEGGQVEDVMKIAQKNYDAKITSITNKDDSALSKVRVHVIKNPEVLKEYVHGLRKRDKSTSSSSDDNSSNGSSLDLDRRRNSKDEIRRNAEFRVDKGESHEISDDKNMKSYSNVDISAKMTRSVQSMEDQVTLFTADKDHRGRKRGDMKTQSHDDHDADKDRNRPKQRIKDETPTDTWDMLTVTANQMSEKTNKDWSNTDATETSKRILWGLYKNKSFKENVKTDEDRKDNDRKKQSNIDDRQQNIKEQKWNAYKSTQQKSSSEDDVNWTTSSKTADRLNDDDKDKVVPKKGDDKNWYDRLTKKKHVVDEWKVTTELGKKAETESWQKVGMDWDKKRATKYTRNWDDPEKFTKHSSQRNEKKKTPVSAFDKPRHVARIRDYELPKNRFQGRTPIPFVGTKGDQVEDVMKVARKNYDAKITLTTNEDDSALSEVRVHVIKNPEVLKKYVRGLRRRDKSTSSSSEDSSSDDSSLFLRRRKSKDEMRQNAEFRVDKGTEGYQVEDVMKISQKNDDAKMTSNTNKDDSALSKVRVHVIKNPEVLEKYVQGLRKRDKSTSSSSDESTSNDSSLDLVRRRNSKNEMRRNVEFKVDKGESYEISDVTNMQSYLSADISVKMSRSMQSMEDQVTPFSANKDHRERNQMLGKKDNDWDNTDATETSKKLLLGVYKNKSFKENVKTDEDRKDNVWKKLSNIDDRQQNFKEQKWIAYDSKQQNSSWEDDVNWKTTLKTADRLSDDDKEKVVPKKGDDKNWYNRTTKKKRVVDEWKVTTELGKKAETRSWQKVGMDWDKKRATKDTRNWDDPGKFTRHSWQRNEKKKKSVSAFNKPRYVARIRDYDMANNGFQGRTPIPFIGKKRIYEDK